MARDPLPPALLPGWAPRVELSRPTAEQINEVESKASKKTLTYAGHNAPIPIVYGEQLVGGPIIAGPATDGGHFVYAVALTWAGTDGIEEAVSVTLGEEVKSLGAFDSNHRASASFDSADVEIRVYSGQQSSIDSWLPGAISGFDDVFARVCYAVVRATEDGVKRLSTLDALRFRIKGRKVFDPRGSVSWEAMPAALPFDLTGVAPTNNWAGGIVALGDTGEIATPNNAWALWTTRNVRFGASKVLAVGRAGAVAVVVGEDGKISTATDNNSTRWEIRSSGITDDLTTVALTYRTITLAGGPGGVLLSGSNSGQNWTVRDPGFGSADVLAVAVSSDRYFAAGEGGLLAESSDLTSWSIVDAGFGNSDITHLVFMADSNVALSPANKLMAFGQDGKAAYSDGTGWTQIDAGFDGADITHAAFDGDRVWALSDSGALKYTSDGDVWHDGRPVGGMRSLFFGGGYLIAEDDDGDTWRVDPEEAIGPAYTENPALHMLDFVTNDEFGLGVQMIGATEAADACDSLYAGLPRSRTGLTIQDSYEEADILAYLASYAEVLWGYDGRDVVVVPDMPPDEVHDIPADEIRLDSFRLDTVGLRQIPTMIRLLFTDRDSPTWASRPAEAEVPEHAKHGMAQMISSVDMAGVYRREEADRRVYQRLMRLQIPGRVEWQMFAPGLPYQAGDVVRLPDTRGLDGVRIRLTAQPDMVAPLLYQMRGELYDSSIYPVFKGGTAVPEGGIVIWNSNNAVPSGWSSMGGSGLIREGSPGYAGTAKTLSVSGRTNVTGGHTGSTNTTDDYMVGYVVGSDMDNAPSYMRHSTHVTQVPTVRRNPEAGDHAHSYSETFNYENSLSRQQFRLIKKTGEPGLLQSGMAFFSSERLGGAGVASVNSYNGRYLASGTSRRYLGGDTRYTIRTTRTGGHIHGVVAGAHIDAGPVGGFYVRASTKEQGEHEHTFGVTITTKLRAKALAMFQAVAKDVLIPEGGIVGWEGSTAPQDWAFCDGDNGTVDLRDYFIVIDHVDNAGNEVHGESQGTYEIDNDTTYAGGHGHDNSIGIQNTNYRRGGGGTNSPHHTNAVGDHKHTISGGSGTVDLSNIRRYQLRFIQYIGA